MDKITATMDKDDKDNAMNFIYRSMNTPGYAEFITVDDNNLLVRVLYS